ncbi:MAG: AbrB/MazE/SpoVT family DNA-binding domain-containing protein [Dehalococcoidales bacterium]|jgi:antitoxin MazE|nr:AbrB/MazE/SpoVT family DNA-binding domain-containing protein [Dehalococcoidales bacterium]
MISRVQKWGNSLALRIPSAFAKEIGLQNETSVDLKQVEGKLVITPLAETDTALEKLLANITEENRHSEIDTGYAVGKEIW